jgi:diaminohydroxyphosphoribosylaminopyrimidine deaminase / 5-amino-6-(5-phosphoribosylamino)uracil reductase
MDSTSNLNDLNLMQHALELARKGGVKAAPNPMVGCVIAKNGDVIGAGFHEQCGSWHAEVNALRSIPSHLSAEGATAYVTLEPCSHYGKTPPCALAFIEAKLSKLVIAIKDPNPLVAGRGIEMLRAAGIDVEVGLLASEN